jgi:endonuclease-8
MIDIVPTTDDDTLVGHLGPDPLREDWDPAEAARRVGSDSRSVHVALLDQRNMAGLGNVYANELCFVKGILPTTPAAETDAASLVDLGARMIRANRDRPVRTFTGDARPGKERWVYGRKGKPCRRCGTAIRSDEVGATVLSERVIYWCPACQT